MMELYITRVSDHQKSGFEKTRSIRKDAIAEFGDRHQPARRQGHRRVRTFDALLAVMSAVNDALASIGGAEIETPAMAEKVWHDIGAA